MCDDDYDYDYDDDDDDGEDTSYWPRGEEDTKLSTTAREYRGRDLDLACLAVGSAR